MKTKRPPTSLYSGALISADGVYRYSLTRTFSPLTDPTVCWIMLNPSKADAHRDDATVRRCIGFSRQAGFGAMMIVNLFALRSTYPYELTRVEDPVGPENDFWIRHVSELCNQVICAWGDRGSLLGRDKQVLEALHKLGRYPYCLGKTKSGNPRHPVRLPYSTKLIPLT